MNAPAQGAAGLCMPSALKPILCLLATGSLLGLTTVLAGLAVRSGWNPIAFLFWSALGSGVLLAGVAGLAGERPKPSLPLLRYALISGLISFALPNMLSFSAIPHVGAGFVSLCLAFPPMLTYGIALFLGMDRASVKGIGGMILGLSGAVLLALSQSSAQDGLWIWIGLALMAPVIIATGNIYRTVDWPKEASPRLLAPVMLLAAAAIIGLWVVFTGIPLSPVAWDRTASMLLFAQMTAVAATYALFFVLQKLSGPVGLSQIGWIGACVGKLLAVLVLAEAVPIILVPAFGLIFIGIVFVSRRMR
ncbi:DMT family transporter [Magnetospirillum molischianum]|uniref:EamA domain-containing protein n=1 Tax=Magnetospirillum molischianum DSM 120 TaxID=1150626 RepID=H8FSQ6_MAGML|nr:DMT family transporter [Magnetospirillum molischianum]CCG41394.1 conserved membrane hypothetical protein [Magnetospirillum molischianum DSM 120]